MNNSFESTFAAELASRAGATVEIATANNLIEGVLSLIVGILLLVIEFVGYGVNRRINMSLNAINFVRFPAAA